MKRIYVVLICLTIFLIPSNLFYKVDVSHAYVHGLLVDYLIPRLSASDLPILAVLSCWWLERVRNKKAKPSEIKSPRVLFFLLLLVALAARQFFSQNAEASWWWLLKLSEMGIFGWFLLQHRTLLNNRFIWISWIGTLLFQVLVGLLQFYRQASVFPSYLFLGEVNFSHAIGLAKDNYFHTVNILAYGTTSHPNVLGGLLVLGSLLLLHQFWSEIQHGTIWFKFLAGSLIALLIWTLVLTQSISAGLTLMIGVGVIMVSANLKKIPATFGHRIRRLVLLTLLLSCIVMVPILLHLGSSRFPNNQSFTRRDTLNQAALAMVEQQPIFGIGLNNFTVNLEEYSTSAEIVRFIQPAHNVVILWLTETGFLGALLVTIGLWKKKYQLLIPVIILVPLLTLDHYLITQQTGLLLTIFFLTNFTVTATA